MFSFPFQAAINQLRTLCRTAYLLPPNGPIPEAGSQPVDLTRARLPIAVLRTRGEVPVEDGNPSSSGASARSLFEHMTVSCWLLLPTSAGEDDVAALRERLILLATAIYEDRRMAGTVTRARVSALNWSGIGESPPFEAEAGIGMISGYVVVDLEFVDLP
jgi:hypothetical protein